MAEFDDVCTDIRSIVNSSKNQMSVFNLQKDYMTIIGSSIPYRKLGYNSVEDLLRAVPNVRLNRVRNDTYIDLKPDEKTAHIAKLVQGQQAAKKKGKKRYDRPAPPRRNSPRSGFNNCSWSSNNYSGNSNNYSGNSNNYGNNSYPKNYTSNFGNYSSNSNSYTSNSRNNVKTDERKVPEREFKNLSVTIGNSSIGAGRGNAVLRGGPSLSKRNFPDNGVTKSREEDIGYRPMNFTSSSMKAVRDVTISSNQGKTLLSKTSPASILASGRAARNEMESQKNSFSNDTNPERLFSSAIRSTLEDVPFKPLNYCASSDTMNPVAPQSENLWPTPLMNQTGSGGVGLSKPTSIQSLKSLNSFPNKPAPAKKIGSFQSGPDTQPSYSSDSFCQKLFAFAIKFKLELPVFSNFNKVDPKTYKTVYTSRVKVDGLSFSSMPHELSDLSQAQERAAENALEELIRRHENPDADLLSTTSERQKIIEQILEIVSPHPMGLKSEAVEQKYRDTFHEKLPADWLEIIKSYSLLSVEKLVGGVFVYPPQDAGGSVQGVNRLPPLVLPEDDEWPILITTSSSTTYVYFRIIGEEYNNKYDDLAQAMDDFYGKKKDRLSSAQIIREGNYYAAHLQNEWYRVKVLSRDLGQTYRVSLVDHGDTEEVLKESIFDLEKEFTNFPAQAIRCGLTGLEGLHNNDYVTYTLKSMTESTTRTGFMARIDSRNPNLMITMFDTTTDFDIDINEVLRQKMEKELTVPSIPTQSSFVEVYLTRVKEDGGAHVQIISDGLKRLLCSMVEVKNEMFKHEEKYRIKSVTNLIGEKIILAKYHVDGSWHRAVVKSILHGNENAQVYFIDYGNTEIVPIKHLAMIKHFECVLTAIPPQAVEVQFMKSSRELFTQTIIEFLMSLAQATNDEEAVSRLFLMKVINNGPVPDVEFFLRDDNNELVRLNDIIGSYYSEYRGKDFKAVDLNLDVSKSFPAIPPFPVPDSGVFPVYVSMVVKPGHFVVQPLECRDELLKMTEEMRKYYTKERPPVNIHQIKVGNVFAVENDQKLWCRGRVIGVLKELSSVSLKCLDYMEIVTVDFKNIHPLMPSFRKLPTLAVKAELAGIAPMHNDWDMTDCLRFHELIIQRELVGVIVHKTEDLVSMILYDFSVQPQIEIGAILVEEGRAVDITKP